MPQLAFLILCHKDPAGVLAQVDLLTEQGDYVAVHFDRRGSDADFERLKAGLLKRKNVVLTNRRIACGWGQWSLVAATLEVMRKGLASFPQASHFYLISGDCAPIKSAEYLRTALAEKDVDHIEIHDFFEGGWIQSGFREERLLYHHIVNERRYKRVFYALYEVQKWLGLKRRLPQGLQICIGSQWWCLRRQTVEKVLAFCAQNPKVVSFFKTTWIPDETFLQTLVAHLVPQSERLSRPPTYFTFHDYGMPVVFFEDHAEVLMAQNAFFARKIMAPALRARLAELYRSGLREAEIEPRRAGQLAHQRRLGRQGRRFGLRIWQEDPSLTQSQTLFVVMALDWELGQAWAKALGAILGVPQYGYLFNAQEAGLPDMGGLERDVERRWRDKGAFIRTLFAAEPSEAIVICCEPGHLGLLRDLAAVGYQLRGLEVGSGQAVELLAHAERAGLSQGRVPEVLARQLQQDMRLNRFEVRQLLGASYYTFDPAGALEESVAVLSKFANLSAQEAGQVIAQAQAQKKDAEIGL